MLIGEAAALTSAGIYALSGVAIAKGAALRGAADNGAFLSVVLTSAVSLALWLWLDGPASLPRTSPASLAAFVGAGIASTVLGRSAMFRSTALGGAVRASAARRLIPVFATVFAVVMLQELPGTGGLVGMALVLAGAALLYRGERNAAHVKDGWLFWGVASAAFYGLAYVLRELAMDDRLAGAMFGAFLGAMVGVMWSLASVVRGARIIAAPNPWQVLAAASLAVAQIGQFVALTYTDVTTVAVIGAAETPISVVLAVWLLRTETAPDARLWLGLGLAVLGVIVIALT